MPPPSLPLLPRTEGAPPLHSLPQSRRTLYGRQNLSARPQRGQGGLETRAHQPGSNNPGNGGGTRGSIPNGGRVPGTQQSHRTTEQTVPRSQTSAPPAQIHIAPWTLPAEGNSENHTQGLEDELRRLREQNLQFQSEAQQLKVLAEQKQTEVTKLQVYASGLADK